MLLQALHVKHAQEALSAEPGKSRACSMLCSPDQLVASGCSLTLQESTFVTIQVMIQVECFSMRGSLNRLAAQWALWYSCQPLAILVNALCCDLLGLPTR